MNSKATTIVATVLLILALPSAARPQDRDVVFVHGLNTHADSWEGAAARLAQRAAIRPHVPDPDWKATFQDQANLLQQELGSLPATTIAIGHSNGGIVSRQWNRVHPLGGIITIGTPHQGVPLLNNLDRYNGFDFAVYQAMTDVADAFGNLRFANWGWVLAAIGRSFSLGFVLSTKGYYTAAVNLGIAAYAPVISQMRVRSSFLCPSECGSSDINSAANLAREQAELSSRVGIVSVAHNFFWGGPLRTAFPNEGDALALLVDVSAIAADFAATVIHSSAEPDDIDGWDLANRLVKSASLLFKIDMAWCAALSEPGMARCWQNDTVVPVWSQDYLQLGATRLVIRGPAHVKQETGKDASYSIEEVLSDPQHTQAARDSRTTDDVLYDVLTRFMNVPPR